MSNAAENDFVCRLDASNTIVAAGGSWSQLLRPSSVSADPPPPYLGRRLWSHLSDATAVHLYQALVAKVRQTARPLPVPFRHDLPGKRLYLEMRICPLPAGGIEFQSARLREEPLQQSSFLGRPRYSAEFIRMCGWCKRIAAPEWVDVEEAICRLKLLESDELLRVTHSICPACAEAVIRQAQGDAG
jgi:hypothetical protein